MVAARILTTLQVQVAALTPEPDVVFSTARVLLKHERVVAGFTSRICLHVLERDASLQGKDHASQNLSLLKKMVLNLPR